MAAQTQLLSPSKPHWNHDVFLSFRGEDTRKTFTDHLYTALVHAGIHTFRDDDELPKGNHISNELLKAIQGSRVSIVVFSKGYASSSWCLDELVEILHCKKTIGQTFLPIFYDVNPSDVRRQTGSFAKAFSRHEERFQAEMERVQKWKAALTEAGNDSGWDIQNFANGYESRSIEKIVEELLHKVNNACLDIAKHPISIDYRVEKIKALLNLGTSDVRIVGIYGMAGIGKTTLAKAVYNQIYNGFEGSSCLLNIKEISEQLNGLVHLQEQLLSDVLKTKNLKIANVDRGINLIKEKFRCKRVLVILDDVNHLKQLNSFVGSSIWFGAGSRIILTTQDEHLLTELGVHEKYKVEELNHEESLQLFSWHAFRIAHPIKDYRELSISVVNYVGGLPLALEILGSYLSGRSTIAWKNALEKLQKYPHHQIQEILRMSFDSLDDDTVKDTFLDIACFFVGMDKDYAIKIFDSCGFFPDIGITILIERSLVTINAKNELRMHDLIRDMGREVVRKMSLKDPGKRSRLWFHEDVLDVLNKHLGSEAIEGLNLSLPALEVENVQLKTEAFAKMKNLRLLQIDGAYLTGCYEHLSKELRWLHWHKCPLKFLPPNFHLENLVILDMQHSNVKQVWKENKVLIKLKVLNLKGSKCLTQSPNFLLVPHLEMLILEGCTSLVEVHESIGHLEKLVLLNLQGCENLKNLPESISNLESLETLNLPDCIKIDKLPKQLGNMVALTHLILKGCTSLVEVHESIGHLEKLLVLDLQGCENLKNIPESISNLYSLVTLNLSDCIKIDKLPKQLGNMVALTYLELEGCTSLVEVHESIGHLEKLLVLDLQGCENLKNIPESISNLYSLRTLNLSGCIKIDKLPKQLGNMVALRELSVDRTTIEQLPYSFGLLKQLLTLSLSGCKGQSSESWMSHFLSWLSQKCPKPINMLPTSISGLCRLRQLDISDCNLYEDEILMNLGSSFLLEVLNLSRNNFRRLPHCIGRLPNLDRLFLEECTSLQSISELPASLGTLFARGCSSLQRLPNVPNQERLRTVFLMDGCDGLAYDFRKSLLQYLSECVDRFRYIVLPGDEVPNWFSYLSTTFTYKGSNILSFQIPSLPKDQIKGLFICAVCEPIRPDLLENVPYLGFYIEINNNRLLYSQTQGCLDAWMPLTLNRERNCCIMYIPNPFTEDEIASGMEMTISLFDMAGFGVVKQCGIHLLVDEPNATVDSEYSMDMASAKRGRDDHDKGAGSSNDWSSDENCQKRSRIVGSEPTWVFTAKDFREGKVGQLFFPLYCHGF